MKWTKEAVEELEELVVWLKKNVVGEVLEKFANFYIKKHHLDMDKYLMDFADNVSGYISNGAYKLAFICDSINERHSHSKKEKHKNKERNKNKNVYECIAHIVKFGLSKKFKIDVNKMGFSQMYLSYIVKEVVFSPSFSPFSSNVYDSSNLYNNFNINAVNIEGERENPLFDKESVFTSIKDLDRKIEKRKEEKEKEKEKHKLKQREGKEQKGDKNTEKFRVEVVNVAYFFVLELVNICEKKEDITRYLPCLISSAENIDLSILSFQQRRAILNVLETKRTLFLRILLLISYELYGTGDLSFYSNPNWLLELVKFNSFSTLTISLTSPLLELALAITTHYF